MLKSNENCGVFDGYVGGRMRVTVHHAATKTTNHQDRHVKDWIGVTVQRALEILPR